MRKKIWPKDPSRESRHQDQAASSYTGDHGQHRKWRPWSNWLAEDWIAACRRYTKMRCVSRVLQTLFGNPVSTYQGSWQLRETRPSLRLATAAAWGGQAWMGSWPSWTCPTWLRCVATVSSGATKQDPYDRWLVHFRSKWHSGSDLQQCWGSFSEDVESKASPAIYLQRPTIWKALTDRSLSKKNIWSSIFLILQLRDWRTWSVPVAHPSFWSNP